MLRPEFTVQFKRDYKQAVKRGCDPKKLETVITLLCKEEPLPEAYRDHALTSSRDYKGVRESAGLAADLQGCQRDSGAEADPHRNPQRPVLGKSA